MRGNLGTKLNSMKNKSRYFKDGLQIGKLKINWYASGGWDRKEISNLSLEMHVQKTPEVVAQ